MDIDEKRRTRLERLAAMPDAEIDTSDIPEVTDWSNAVCGGEPRPRAEVVTVRLDGDVLAWLTASSADVESRDRQINRALREHLRQAAGGRSSG